MLRMSRFIADNPPEFGNSLKIIYILISLENGRHEKMAVEWEKWIHVNKSELVWGNIFENWNVVEVY